MRDPRLSTALRQLAHLGQDPPPSRWRWATVTVEGIGRVTLPTVARQALDAPGEVRSRSRGRVLLLALEGAGARLSVDRRGRLYVPVWLRDAAGGTVLVGARLDPALLVLLAPVEVLDDLGDQLAKDPR